jgi:DNA-binding MarR family transcriptional regulator
MKKPTNPTLEDKELQVFRASLRQLVRKIDRRLRSEIQCCGVSYLMSHILLELEQSGALSLKQLQEILDVDKATLSRSVDLLVKDGLASRTENPEDRRSIEIKLSAAGRKQVAELNQLSNAGYRKVFECISPQEHAAVISAVRHLTTAFDQVGIESSYALPLKKDVP